MQILVATLRGAVHQQQRAAAYVALLPSLLLILCLYVEVRLDDGVFKKLTPLVFLQFLMFLQF